MKPNLNKVLAATAFIFAIAGAVAEPAKMEVMTDVYAYIHQYPGPECIAVGTCSNNVVFACTYENLALYEYHEGTGTCQIFARGQFTSF